MRKFLIVLAMVAMASLLMGAGCFVTPDEPVIPNNPPEITSSAITSGKVGVVYNYDVNATDPEGDILTYSLTEKPLGMSIVATTGIISWTPTDVGFFGVVVKVSDPDGLSDVQGFNITVAKADEPVEPGLVLVGIEVDPKTMDLFVGEEEAITSVTATYVIRGYDVDIALEDCLFLTSNSKIATVDKDGLVTAVKVGTADIIVSYKDKTGTLEVTVVAHTPMKMILDIPLFTVDATGLGETDIFTMEIVANDDADKMVKFYFTLPGGIVDTTVPLTLLSGDYTLEFLSGDATWLDLGLLVVLPGHPLDVVLGEALGDPLIDEVRFFKATFSKEGIYETTIEVWEVTSDGEKDVLLYSKDISVLVVTFP